MRRSNEKILLVEIIIIFHSIFSCPAVYEIELELARSPYIISVKSTYLWVTGALLGMLLENIPQLCLQYNESKNKL